MKRSLECFAQPENASHMQIMLNETELLAKMLNEIKEKLDNLQNHIYSVGYELENERVKKKCKPSYIN
jgi:hypothetical protein